MQAICRNFQIVVASLSRVYPGRLDVVPTWDLGCDARHNLPLTNDTYDPVIGGTAIAVRSCHDADVGDLSGAGPGGRGS
jgi:hypothetical protein